MKVQSTQPMLKQRLRLWILPAFLSIGLFSASVSQGQTLTDIYWNPFNTNGVGGSGSWSTTPTNWSFNSAGSAQASNIVMPTVGTNVSQSAYYRYNFGGSNGTVTIGSSQSALGAVNISSSGYIFSQSGAFSGGGNVGGVATNATTTLGSGVRVDFSCNAGGAWTIQSNSISGNPDGTSFIYFTGTNASAGTYTWNIQRTTTLTNVTVFINSQGDTNATSAMIIQNGGSSTGGHPSINANIVNNSTNGVPLTLGVASSGNLTNAGTISGSNGVIFRVGGSGNIVLAASNSYRGGSTLTNSGSGSLDLDRVTRGHFGSGDIAVLGSSTFFYIRSLINEVDITNNIRIDGVLREAVLTSGWRLTNSGTISGTGSILSTNSGSNLYLTGTNNSFGGGVRIANGTIFVNSFGRAGSNSSIGTNGLITLGGPGVTATGISIRTVSTNDETSDKVFLLSGANGVQGQIESNLGSTLTLTSDLQSAGAGTHTLQLSGKTNVVLTTVGANTFTNTYTGKVAFNGLLADASGITNVILVSGTGTGIVQLGNSANSFGSPVIISNATSGQATTLQVSQFGVPGQNSPLGTNGTIIIGGVGGSISTLDYTGSGEVSSKTITLGGSTGTVGLSQSGSGLLKLTGSILSGTTSGARKLVLSGSSAGTGELASNLGDPSGFALSIEKNGFGTWRLSGVNTYSGGTTISGGTLKIGLTNVSVNSGFLAGASSTAGNATLDMTEAENYVMNSYGAIGTSGASMVFTNSSGSTDPLTLTFTNANNYITTGSASGRTLNNSSGNLTIAFNGAVDIGSSANNDVTFTGPGSFTLNGPLTTSGTGVRALTKSGNGTLTLNAASGYNGVTTISAGILSLRSSAALGTNSVVMNGGTMRVDVNGTNESKGNLTLTGNANINLGTVNTGQLRFASATNWTVSSILTVANSSVGAKLYITDTNNVQTSQIKSEENPNAVASLALDGLLSFSSGIAAPSGLFYTNINGTVGTAITSVEPTVTGTPTEYSISSALPAGLLFDTTTGMISGTPTATAASTNYTVTATNAGGSTTGTVTVAVVPAESSGPTIEEAYPGKDPLAINPDNGLTYLLNYAFGGSDTTAPRLPVLDTSDPAKLTLVAYVRTGGDIQSVVGETASTLPSFDSVNTIPGEPIPSFDTPIGMEKRKYSVMVSGDRKFLRLKVTKR